ncbi:MAG: hypothetical protein M1814_003024 [Vezdaea aestivalis]|nr:MAG: hypothetical protein M1814_003024 [Vezdaea aestivalis]
MVSRSSTVIAMEAQSSSTHLADGLQLLQVATSVADQSLDPTSTKHDQSSMDLSKEFASTRRNRTRNSLKPVQSTVSTLEQFPAALPQQSTGRKRKRISQTSPQNDGEQQPEALVEDELAEIERNNAQQESSAAVALSDARAAGVHSAAALFRQPSDTSKKYTRPPMSKLYSSLQLSPENFLHLQGAAKAYMLDPNHPDRQDCVGNRGKGDTDMVRLRLYNCVRDFLDGEGNGVKYFGHHVPQAGGDGQRLVWPIQINPIISVVTPLLRRMVTNERQRQYAVEVRKAPGGSATSTPQKSTNDPADQQALAALASYQSSTQLLPESTNIFETSHSPIKGLGAGNAILRSATKRQKVAMPFEKVTAANGSGSSNPQTAEGEVTLRVSIIEPLSSVTSRINGTISETSPETHYTEVSSIRAPSLSTLIQGLRELGFEPSNLLTQDQVMGEDNSVGSTKRPRIECLLETGLVEIANEHEYTSALETVRSTLWMEAMVRFIVHL